MPFTYMLAPMEENSDNALRTLCYRQGADLTFTEMIRVQALARKNKSTWSRLIAYDGTPTCIQLLASKEDDLTKFLSCFSPQKGFSGFNLNLGCPSPDVVRVGLGCAMMKRIEKIKKLTKVIQDHSHQVSIKMRLGLNTFEKEKKAYLHLINAIDADFFVIHARHGGQKYVEPADFNIYKGCVATGKTIIANGDIRTKQQVEMLKDIGIKGAMLGRAAVQDPSIFSVLKGKPSLPIGQLRKEYLQLAQQYKTPQKYVDNVLRRMGKDTTKEDQRLLI